MPAPHRPDPKQEHSLAPFELVHIGTVPAAGKAVTLDSMRAASPINSGQMGGTYQLIECECDLTDILYQSDREYIAA